MVQLVSQIAVNGLTSGLIYILMALGFTLIFGIMRVVNFAHGELYMVGAFAVLVLTATVGLNYYVALVLAMLIVGALGVIIERTLLRPFVGREMNGMIMALAISISLQALVSIIFGPQDQFVQRPITGVFHVDAVSISVAQLFVGGAALVILVIFYFFLRYARFGLAIRAVAEEPEAAALQGIRPSFIYMLTFGIGSLLAGLAGALMAPIYTVNPYMGSLPMMKAFIVVILGGLGSLFGAVVGGLLLGLVESAVATMYSSNVATIAGFGLVVVILVFRPAGLMGRTQ